MKRFERIPFHQVQITGGFWHERQKINREVTVQAVYNRFSDTHRFEALACKWHEGMPNRPHFFWDSDVAKWMEGVAYLLMEQRDERLERLVDHAVEDIIRNQDELGYFNSHFLVTRQDERFKKRNDHELYCAGHLIEAACAYHQATGKDAFLNAMIRYADYIYDTFYVYQTAAFTVCGHPEIELALVKLADATGNAKYLELSRFFVDMRGNNQKDRPIADWCNHYYDQSHMPLKQQETAEGHSVRALYIYSAMADIAARYQDEEYLFACEKLFDNITQKRMYITGATGSTHIGEAFTVDYDLPNKTAYAETCASIALALFARRMLALRPEAKYADAIERVMYNGALAGVSLDGKSFFYENPLEIDPRFANVNTSTNQKQHMPIMQRMEVFGCSCCPPNIVRFISSIADTFYSMADDTLYVHQYARSDAQIGGASIHQETDYPSDGAIRLTFSGGTLRRAALRIPGWCQQFELNVPYELKNGYAYADLPADGVIELKLDMAVQLMESHACVQENANRVAVMRGPVVYCLEGVDNGECLRSLSVRENSAFEQINLDPGIPALRTLGVRKTGQQALYARYCSSYEPAQLTFIPYYAYANRGVTEMTVWVHVLP